MRRARHSLRGENFSAGSDPNAALTAADALHTAAAVVAVAAAAANASAAAALLLLTILPMLLLLLLLLLFIPETLPVPFDV